MKFMPKRSTEVATLKQFWMRVKFMDGIKLGMGFAVGFSIAGFLMGILWMLLGLVLGFMTVFPIKDAAEVIRAVL